MGADVASKTTEEGRHELAGLSNCPCFPALGRCFSSVLLFDLSCSSHAKAGFRTESGKEKGQEQVEGGTGAFEFYCKKKSADLTAISLPLCPILFQKKIKMI